MVGGTTGDQTGTEICVRSYYNYNPSWNHVLRYNQEVQEAEEYPRICISWNLYQNKEEIMGRHTYDLTETDTVDDSELFLINPPDKTEE